MKRVILVIVTLLMSQTAVAKNCPGPSAVVGDWIFESTGVLQGESGTLLGYVRISSNGTARFKGVQGLLGSASGTAKSGRWFINSNSCLLVVGSITGDAGQMVVFRGAVANNTILFQLDQGPPLNVSTTGTMLKTEFSPFN